MVEKTNVNICIEENNNEVVDYFIFHVFFQILIERYPKEWNRVVPFSNSVPHILLLRLFDEYNDDIWNAVTAMTPFHKLSYKFESSETCPVMRIWSKTES